MALGIASLDQEERRMGDDVCAFVLGQPWSAVVAVSVQRAI